ncbi:hypothetical protein NHH73_25090 [Oxalobacteraceae bacterium OTU3CINTB1]|nr:hypothetical protein NHH73_25090 [Oxalobacteraceae bacterium OTU3CINTB1]
MSAPADIKLAKSGAERLQLSQIEQRLIVDFRRMSSKSRTCVSKFSTATADSDVEKARKTAPALRLVVGGSR